MSERDLGTVATDFLSALNRDVSLLLPEGIETLGLSDEEVPAMWELIEVAWLCGSGDAHKRAEAAGGNPRRSFVTQQHIDLAFRFNLEGGEGKLGLLEEQQPLMRDLLERARSLGRKAYQVEAVALFIESQADVGEEAQRWLGGEGESKP